MDSSCFLVPVEDLVFQLLRCMNIARCPNLEKSEPARQKVDRGSIVLGSIADLHELLESSSRLSTKTMSKARSRSPKGTIY